MKHNKEREDKNLTKERTHTEPWRNQQRKIRQTVRPNERQTQKYKKDRHEEQHKTQTMNIYAHLKRQTETNQARKTITNIKK